MAKNQVENISVGGWDVTVTYMPDNGKYVAEAFDSKGQKFDYVASHDRQQTIDTAVALANAGEYYRSFGGGSTQSGNTTNEFFRDYESETKQKPRQTIKYHNRAPFSLGKLLLAAVIVIVLVFLTCPAIMAVVGWLFRL